MTREYHKCPWGGKRRQCRGVLTRKTAHATWYLHTINCSDTCAGHNPVPIGRENNGTPPACLAVVA